MTARQEFASWFAPAKAQVHQVPDVNATAPAISDITFPRSDGKPVIVAFLRHCGCPFAEKIFLKLRKVAEENKSVQCVAVSHSDQDSTSRWLDSVGGAGSIKVVVDEGRKIYGEYGLGISSYWAVLNPWSMANVFKLGREEQIWNRPTESGTRWQTAGLFAVDSQGAVKYSHPSQTTDDLGDVDEALNAVSGSSKL